MTVALLSKEAEKELLASITQHLEKRLELEREKDLFNNLDLLQQEQVINSLGVSTTTLFHWRKMGLKTYQSPYESSKKVYYKKSDILDFLTVK